MSSLALGSEQEVSNRRAEGEQLVPAGPTHALRERLIPLSLHKALSFHSNQSQDNYCLIVISMRAQCLETEP